MQFGNRPAAGARGHSGAGWRPLKSTLGAPRVPHPQPTFECQAWGTLIVETVPQWWSRDVYFRHTRDEGAVAGRERCAQAQLPDSPDTDRSGTFYLDSGMRELASLSLFMEVPPPLGFSIPVGVAHHCNPSLERLEAGGLSWSPGQPGLQYEPFSQKTNFKSAWPRFIKIIQKYLGIYSTPTF